MPFCVENPRYDDVFYVMYACPSRVHIIQLLIEKQVALYFEIERQNPKRILSRLT